MELDLTTLTRVRDTLRAEPDGLTARQVADRVLVERPPSVFPLPLESARDALRTLRKMGVVTYAGRKWRAHDATELENELPPDYLVDRVAEKVYTDRWHAQGGRLVLFVREGRLSLWMIPKAELRANLEKIPGVHVEERKVAIYPVLLISAPPHCVEDFAAAIVDDSYRRI